MNIHALLFLFFLALAVSMTNSRAQAEPLGPVNIAPAATPSSSFVSGHESLASICSDVDPRNSQDHSRGAYGNWPSHGTQWVQYEWAKAISTNGIGVYWWADHQGIRLPTAARLSYWDGQKFLTIDGAVGVSGDRINVVNFPDVVTTKLRLEMDADGTASTGVLVWKVYDTGKSPAFPPTAHAGPDRVVVLNAATYLTGTATVVRRPEDVATVMWSKGGGPGEVTFADAHAADTTARFSSPGEYRLRFEYTLRGLTSHDDISVRVEPQPAVSKLNAVYVSKYKIDSPFWKDRLKNQIVHWIPHCIAENEKPNLAEGGINNLIEAGKKLRGETAKPHIGYPFSNAWVLNTIESMCVALTVDPDGDTDIQKAQDGFRAKLEEWIPIVLAAQEKDGYFQTRFTLGTPRENRAGLTPTHWNPALRTEHEGYIAGYFIEMGIAHHIATSGKDRRLFDAALKLADCWVDHIGPAPKRAWYDGHQEIEQALVRLGRYVNDVDGPGRGAKYIDLAKFLLDSRAGGQEYDQSQRPITQQYTAVGHAVRAAYTYSAMADVAMETGDPNYWSATQSIWDNLINRKYYVTGGIGSGETSEGFGGDYSLPNSTAYVESCSSCGLLFMQYKLNLATHDAKYADLYETTLFNAILGSTDLEGKNFTYTNSLDSDERRYPWHVCPCCVGNIPRTLLMLPTWMYATGPDAVFVNLFAGSTVNVGTVAGSDVEVVQATDYPWGGKVKLTVNPKRPADFTLNIRSPRREVSALYTATPHADGIASLTVNGQPINTTPNEHGYVAVKRLWTAGDHIEFELPLPVQMIKASDRIASTRGRVALRRGPLVYNIESIDQDVNQSLGSGNNLGAAWTADLLGGVIAIRGEFTGGSPLLAVPNYARLNRSGRSLVWIKQ